MGLEKGMEKSCFSFPLKLHIPGKTANINVRMKNPLRRKKDHDEFEAFFNYFYHTSSSVDEKLLLFLVIFLFQPSVVS